MSMMTMVKGLMSRTPAENKNRSRWITRVGLIGLSSALLVGLGAGAAHADDDEDLSVYAVASSVTSYFTSALNPDSDREVHDSWVTVQAEPGTAGAVVGYADKDLNPVEWLISQMTASSQTIEYSSLEAMGGGVREYAEFGATLSALGLDTTGQGMASGLTRNVLGISIKLTWGLAEMVTGLFSGVLTILKWLNPFELLFMGVSEANGGRLADGMVSGDANDGWLADALAGLTNYLGGIYTVVSSLSWAVLMPLFMLVTLVFVALGKARGGAIKKLVVRLLFIAIGIPVLGTMYTGTLDSMKEATSGEDSGAVQVVASTFVDFEGWATQARLAVPSGATIQWDRTASEPTTKSYVEVQDSAREINALVHKDLRGMKPLFSLGSGDTWSADYDASQVAADTKNAAGAINALLDRFIEGETVKSASFASSVQSGLTENNDASDWFSDLRDDDLDFNVADNPLVNVASGSALSASVSDDQTVRFTTPAASQTTACGATVASGSGEARPCSMSALAMYNYLNTTFDATSMTTYSPAKVASGAVVEVHDSVSIVGTGLASMIYWINALATLASFAIIGIGYAISLLMSNLSKGAKMLAATPFAMFGAIGAITKVLVHVVTMVLEILVTMFLFMLVQQLLLAIPRVFSHAAATFLESGMSALSPTFSLMVPLLGAVVLLAFAVMALRLRKSVVKAISEVASKIIEAVTGGSSGTQDAPGGAMKSLAGGAAAGAGMAAGMKVAGSAGPKPASPAAGPAAVSAGGTAQPNDGGGALSQEVAVSGGGGGGGAAGSAVGPSGSGGGGGAGGTSSGGIPGTSRSSHTADEALGEQVQTKGLTANPASGAQGAIGGALVTQSIGSATKVGTPGGAGGSTGSSGSSGASTKALPAGSGASSTTRRVAADDSRGDVLDSAYDSFDRDNTARKNVAKDKRSAAVGAAGAVGTGAKAVARGAAGDGVGAVGDGLSAVNQAGSAANKAQQARSNEKALDREVSSGPRTTGNTAQPPQRAGNTGPQRSGTHQPQQRSGSGAAPQRSGSSAPVRQQSSRQAVGTGAKPAQPKGGDGPAAQRPSTPPAPRTPRRALPVTTDS